MLFTTFPDFFFHSFISFLFIIHENAVDYFFWCVEL